VLVATSLVVVNAPPALAATPTDAPPHNFDVQPGGSCSVYSMDDNSVPYNASYTFSCALAGTPVRLSGAVCDGAGSEDAQLGAANLYSCRSHWYHWAATLDNPTLSTLNPDTWADPNVDQNNNTTMGGAAYNSGISNGYASFACSNPNGDAPTSLADVAGNATGRIFARSSTSSGMIVRGMSRVQLGNRDCSSSSGRCTQPIGNGDDNNVQWWGCSSSGTGNDLPGGTLFNAAKRASDVPGAQNVRLWACYDVLCSSRQEVHIAPATRVNCTSGCVNSVTGGAIVPRVPLGTNTCNLDVYATVSGANAMTNTSQVNLSTSGIGATVRFACYLPTALNQFRLDMANTDHVGKAWAACVNLVDPTPCVTAASPGGWNTFTTQTTIVQRQTPGGIWAYESGSFSLTPTVLRSAGDTVCNTGTYYPRDGTTPGYQTQACMNHPTFDFATSVRDLQLTGYGSNTLLGQDGSEAFRVEQVTYNGTIPAPPLIAPGATHEPVPSTSDSCKITSFKVKWDNAPSGYIVNLGGSQLSDQNPVQGGGTIPQIYWFHQNNYHLTVTFDGQPTRLQVRLNDVQQSEQGTSDGDSQTKIWNNPTSPVTWDFEPLHEGFAVMDYSALDSLGRLCDGGAATDTPSHSWSNVANASQSNLQKCLTNAYDGVSNFDLTDPTTWTGALVSALNPASFVQASLCIAEALVIPNKPMSYWSAAAQQAYSGTTIDKLVDAAKTPASAVNAFQTNANTTDCHGPEVDVRGIVTHPIDSCSHSEMRDIVQLAGTVLIYLGGGVLIAKMFLSAMGVKMPVPGGGGPSEGDG
jgi:hypothetical protein